MYKIHVNPKLPILFIVFDTVVEMNRAMLRAQEYAEHPKLEGTVMSHSRLKDFYGRHPYKYAKGLNMPGLSYMEFCGKATLSAHEQELFDKVHGFFPNGENFYLIAAGLTGLGSSSYADKHELSHALFTLCSDYREAALALLEASEFTPDGLKVLLAWSIYGPKVLKDELMAYLATDTDAEFVKHFHIYTTTKAAKDLRRDAVALFNTFNLRYGLETQ